MKLSFFEYEESEHSIQTVWDNPKTIFVFDTNIFLKLYGFHEDSRQKIYEALDKIKERLWSPHQVMLEFHINKDYHIEGNKNTFRDADKFIAEFLGSFSEPYKKLHELKRIYKNNFSVLSNLIDPFVESAGKELSQTLNDLHTSLKEKLAPIEAKLIELKSQLIISKNHDSLYQKLCELYSDAKIGKAFTQIELDQIYKEGVQRYQNQVPPGYEDNRKSSIYHYRGSIYHSKFGDLILYKQILEHCKKHDIKNVIFISEDNTKGDWVDKNTKTIRREIRGEAFEVAGIQNFIMMNKDSFLEHSEIKIDSQLREDFDRADNEKSYKDKINNWSILGIRIFDIIQDDIISIEDKLILLERIKGSKLSLSDTYLVGSALVSKFYPIIYKAVTYDCRKLLKGVVVEIDRIIKSSDLSIGDKVDILEYLCDDIFSFPDQVGLRMYLEEFDDVNATAIVLKCLHFKEFNKENY